MIESGITHVDAMGFYGAISGQVKNEVAGVVISQFGTEAVDVHATEAVELNCKRVMFLKGNKFTLRFDPGLHGTGKMESRQVEIGSKFKFPECGFQAEDKWGFSYWTITGADGLYPVGQELEIAYNDVLGGVITVTAKWSELREASIITDCVGQTLDYVGTAQKLVSKGSTAGGKMNYAIGSDANNAPTSGWSENIPEGTQAGIYYVWYKAKGDSTHYDTDPKCVTATINPKEVIITANAQSKACHGKDPELTYEVTGLIGGDAVSGTLEREAGEAVGTYEIRQGTLSAGQNYYISFTGATFTIIEEQDYLKELRAMLQSAIARGGEQTVTWAKGTSLPNDIMKTLEDHPQITLIFKYSYEGKGYTVTLSGKYVKAWKNIPWFGPLYLYGNYGQYGAGTASSDQATGVYVVKRGDNLTKIARELKVTVAHLVQRNQIKNPNLIWARQVLRY